MVATDWQSLYPKAPADFVPAGYAISGLFDLTPLLAGRINQDFGSTPTKRARRVAGVLAGRRKAHFRCGGRRRGVDRIPAAEPARRDSWGKAGVATRYEEIAGTNHFSVVDPLTDPRSAMVGRLVELAGAVK